MTVKEAMEKRFEAVKELEQLRDRFDGSDQWEEHWKEANKKLDKLTRYCDTEERMREISAQMQEDAKEADERYAVEVREGRAERGMQPREGDIDTAIRGWTQYRRGIETTYEQRSASKRLGIDIHVNEIEIPLRELRALGQASGAEGAETVPQGFRATLEVALKAIGSVRAFARVITTDTGNTMPMPVVTDTANIAEQLNEGSSITGSGQESDDPNFETVTSTIYKYNSGRILVSSELMQDSAFDLGSELGTLLGTRLRRRTNALYTTGSGSGQPQGHITGSLLGSDAQGTQQSAASASISYEDIVNLIHAVDPEYRMSPRTAFVCNDTTVGDLRKIRDASGGSGTTTGQPMWDQSMQTGEPSRLFGFPVFMNQNMDALVGVASTDADKETIAFGDWNKFLIRDAGSVRLRMLTELYAATDQVGFVAFLRTDSRALWTSNWEEYPIKVLQQA